MRLFIFTADNQPASLGSTPELASKEESQPGRPAPPGQTPHRKLVTTLSRRKPRQPSGAQLLPSIPTPTPHLGEAKIIPGDVLLSHEVYLEVPSGLEGLTAVFGMGTGVAPSLESPGKPLTVFRKDIKRVGAVRFAS